MPEPQDCYPLALLPCLGSQRKEYEQLGEGSEAGPSTAYLGCVLCRRVARPDRLLPLSLCSWAAGPCVLL